ncbi:forkhead box protein N2 isoform X2 [Ixodes scapularis]|uniref:forkhead box protein N2 isoform X2 n=1 Tax=Ixodes scapularis TaxID=6945 RepID=UPI001A9D9794|nr:forkhead box protein N2 isoform X2 [Ixodes scapularis]
MAVEEQPMREEAELGSAAQAAPPHRGGGGLPVGGRGGTTPPGASTPAKGGVGGGQDDELTSLSWLQDTNLLRRLATGGGQGGSATEGGEGDEEEERGDEAQSAGGGSSSGGEEEEEAGHRSREWGPPGQVRYNPQVHVNSKPPYSFSCLIFMAIEESAGKALPVKDIYAWILGHFPYFESAPTGWKNSVRHNLSLNKCFRKVDKDRGQNVGKGSLWCIDPEYRPNLLQAMRKTPCFPYTQLSSWGSSRVTPRSVPSSLNCDRTMPLDSTQIHTNVPSPTLFPFLSKRLAASSTKDQDVDAAATMLSLQNGPSILNPPSDDEEDGQQQSSSCLRTIKKKHLRLRSSGSASTNSSHSGGPEAVGSPPHHRLGNGGHSPAGPTPTIITSSPSEDHTYSASLANGNDAFPSANNGAPPVVVKTEPASYDDEYDDDANNNRSVGVRRLASLPASSVPPRKRKAAAMAAAAPQRKSKRGEWRRNASAKGASLSVGGPGRRGEAEEMAEGAHALLNLAKVATNQQQALLLVSGRQQAR